ncbi:TetR/AcrR family transcriptional regulator [Alkalicoccobacillus porphyridii]|uniref:TetR/AcrR family transcriptional regulator n=1 Tax=Alkalicoccobacillus porphyridii TaxID=2597270 RepID=A0A554A1P6_9BACI|nr:TetR-like C-terminal domain-containing protein [Alkalicoccobacillus porphyridii]TSB47621.1 TetR/AcrR family transcriptional regulator [Alkalicoccobacillus porphyridii]
MSPRRGLTISDIVDSAGGIADQEGLHQLSIGAVAKDLNIKPPSLYNHVRGLDELHDLLAVHGCQRLYKNLYQATAGYNHDKALKQLCYAYIEFARVHPGQYEAASRSAHKGNPVLKEAQERVVEVVRDVLYQYGLEEERSVHLIRMLRSMLHGFVTLDSAKGFGMPYDLQDTLDIMIETFIQGI